MADNQTPAGGHAPDTDLRSVAGREAPTAPPAGPQTESDDRCPYVNEFYRRPASRLREDGWRCGLSAEIPHNHTLYNADGERVLDTVGPWVLLSVPPGEAASR